MRDTALRLLCAQAGTCPDLVGHIAFTCIAQRLKDCCDQAPRTGDNNTWQPAPPLQRMVLSVTLPNGSRVMAVRNPGSQGRRARIGQLLVKVRA
eukprot:670534-Rhodomonas_salina.1